MLIAALSMSACTVFGAASAPPTVKIGLVAPFEGLHRPLGYEALFAAKLALQERNQRGGVNGYRVELVALNDFDDPLAAESQARALAADPGVLGVVGHLSSESTRAAMPRYQDAKLAVSIPWTTVATEQGHMTNGVVSVAASAAETSARLKEVMQSAGYHNVAGSLDQISDNVEAIVLDSDGVTAGATVLALRQAEMHLPVFGQANVGSPQLVQVAKEAANGLTYVSPGPAPADVEAEVFDKAYQALAGFPPGPRAVLTYDATNILLDAIEQTHGVPTRAAVRAVINDVHRRGLSGDIAFDAQGQRLNAPVWVYQIFNTEYPGTLVGP